MLGDMLGDILSLEHIYRYTCTTIKCVVLYIAWEDIEWKIYCASVRDTPVGRFHVDLLHVDFLKILVLGSRSFRMTCLVRGGTCSWWLHTSTGCTCIVRRSTSPCPCTCPWTDRQSTFDTYRSTCRFLLACSIQSRQRKTISLRTQTDLMIYVEDIHSFAVPVYRSRSYIGRSSAQSRFLHVHFHLPDGAVRMKTLYLVLVPGIDFYMQTTCWRSTGLRRRAVTWMNECFFFCMPVVSILRYTLVHVDRWCFDNEGLSLAWQTEQVTQMFIICQMNIALRAIYYIYIEKVRHD